MKKNDCPLDGEENDPFQSAFKNPLYQYYDKRFTVSNVNNNQDREDNLLNIRIESSPRPVKNWFYEKWKESETKLGEVSKGSKKL